MTTTNNYSVILQPSPHLTSIASSTCRNGPVRYFNTYTQDYAYHYESKTVSYGAFEKGYYIMNIVGGICFFIAGQS